MRRNGSPGFEELLKPLPRYSLRSLYYGLVSLFLGTVGQLSDGIRTGWKYGFDSGVLMNYVYDNSPGGKFYIGRKLDEAFLNQVTCRAWRAVKEIQKNMILSYLSERDGRDTFIADMASGEADYLFDVLRQTGPGVRALLRDINETTLERSRRTASRLGVSQRVSFKRGDALDPESLRAAPEKPDLVIEAGLYGIIHDDALVRAHLAQLRDILNPDALLFNVQTQNPQIELIARVFRNQEGERCVWHLRPVEDVIGWAEEAGFREPRVTYDPYRIYAVVMMRS
ncbi:MAG: class I SAM-dependent methyltransferase family protein [Thermodesulfobacteriota bacterium]